MEFGISGSCTPGHKPIHPVRKPDVGVGMHDQIVGGFEMAAMIVVEYWRGKADHRVEDVDATDRRAVCCKVNGAIMVRSVINVAEGRIDGYVTSLSHLLVARLIKRGLL
jgi:hypothetical protein